MNELTTGNKFSLEPTNLQEAMQLAELMSSSQMVPKDYQGKPANVLTSPEKDEIMLTMAEALGFYDPTP